MGECDELIRAPTTRAPTRWIDQVPQYMNTESEEEERQLSERDDTIASLNQRVGDLEGRDSQRECEVEQIKANMDMMYRLLDISLQKHADVIMETVKKARK
eukprot:3903059-Prymnesium_polylepis.2